MKGTGLFMKDINQLYENIKPGINDEDFIISVKSKARRLRRKRTAIVTMIATLLTLILSVGTASGWNYLTIISNFFNEDKKIISALEAQPEYVVLQNTFDSLNFDLTGVYSDSGSLFMVIDVTSDYDLFEEGVSYLNNYRNDSSLLEFSDGTEINAGRKYRASFIDKKHIKMLYDFFNLEGIDFSCEELIFRLDGFCVMKESTDLFLINGCVELKFTVPENNENNQIVTEPNIPLKDSDIIINKIYITPYLMTIDYVYPTVKKEDGTYYDEWKSIDIKYKTQNGKLIEIKGLSSVGTGINDEVTKVSMAFMFDKAFDVNNIIAIEVNGTEIKIK